MAGTKINIKPDKIHSAITTWSGFVYQGKIALYHSIKLLTDDVAAASYLLQLDSLEDFAIMAAANTCLSLHQIKALKTKYYSGYEGAFKKLCAKGKHLKCKDLSFHVAVEITDKTPANIALVHPNMKLYKYHDGEHYCPLKNVDAALEHIITEFYKKHAATDGWKQQAAYVTITKNVLDDVIQCKVLDIHQKVHASVASDNALAYSETVSFSIIKSILEEDLNDRTAGEVYIQALMKGDLNRYYEEWYLSCDEPVSQENQDKMSGFMIFVNQLSNSNFLQFCRQIMPHRQVALNNFSQYKDTTFQKEDLKFAFFKALFELKTMSLAQVENIGWRLPTGGTFAPTAISRSADEIEDVCKMIAENILETDFDMPYETSTLVTAHMNVDSLQTIINNINNVSEEDELPTTPEEEKIMRWKKIALCSISEAKKHVI